MIDDSIDQAENLAATLELLGHDVRTAHDGKEALGVATSFRPDVVLCDIGLPGMDGFQVARAFRAHHALKETYLVAVTGYAFPEDVQRSLAAGFDRHLAKPTPVAKLEEVFLDAPARPILEP